MSDFIIKNGVLVKYLGNSGDVVIPDCVTSIGWGAFYGCVNLTSITIPNGVTRIGSWAFWGCKSLTSITIPNSVTSIDVYAFSQCTSLTSVTIPDSVTSIGDSAFYGCSGLTKVNITDIKAWCGINFSLISNPLYYAHNLYLNNKPITDLVIPEGVTSIGDYAFSGCSGLTSITIPDSVTSIGSDAFYECTGLANIIIPNSVTSIGSSAFYGCSGLMSKQKNYKACKIVGGKFMCRNVEYILCEGSEEISDIEPCERGYHFCTNLFNIFNHYSGEIDKDIAIFECEVGDEVITSYDKCVTNKIKLVKRLYREDVIRILNGEGQ